MTITAGISCADGAIVASDTLVTRPDGSRGYTRKIAYRHDLPLAIAFAGLGEVFGDSLVDQVGETLGVLADSSPPIEELLPRALANVLPFLERAKRLWPSDVPSDQRFVDLLCGLCLNGTPAFMQFRVGGKGQTYSSFLSPSTSASAAELELVVAKAALVRARDRHTIGTIAAAVRTLFSNAIEADRNALGDRSMMGGDIEIVVVTRSGTQPL